MLWFFPVTVSAPGTPGSFRVANDGLTDSSLAR